MVAGKTFKGIAHPPPRRDGKRNNIADLNAAEIGTSRAGRHGLPGRPVLVEHDTAGGQVGHVLTSWEGPGGELRVEGVLSDPTAIGHVASGRMRELSLGTSVHTDMARGGAVMMRSHDELSICEKAARPGCIITEYDGKTVGSSHHFAKPRESFSAEYVAKLKAELEAKSASEAALKSKFATYETRQRAQLAEMQPAVQAWIKEGLDVGSEFKHEMESMVGFGDNLHQASNLDSAMPLARMISCHSAKIKREREEFSQASGAAEALGKANKEIDTLKADVETKSARINELEGLVNERTTALERSNEELAKAGLIKEKHDFSLATSREAAPMGGSTAGSVSRDAPAAPFVDPLLSFVQKGSSGITNGRIGLSATNHHILGAGGAGDSGIGAALRMAF